MGAEPVGCVEVVGQIAVTEQRVNLFVAGGADVDGGTKVLPIALLGAFGVLLGYEVVNGELRTVALAKLAVGHSEERGVLKGCLSGRLTGRVDGLDERKGGLSFW